MDNGSWTNTAEITQPAVNKTASASQKLRIAHADQITVNLRGRIGTNLEITQYPSGAVSARFRMAVSKKGRDENNQWHDLGATWYTVRMWGKLADNAQRSLRKGEPVLVSGRLEINEWQHEETGQIRTELVIVANSVGHDLNYGVASFGKIRTPSEGAQQALAENKTHVLGENKTRTETNATQTNTSFETAVNTVEAELGIEDSDSVMV